MYGCPGNDLLAFSWLEYPEARNHGEIRGQLTREQAPSSYYQKSYPIPAFVSHPV